MSNDYGRRLAQLKQRRVGGVDGPLLERGRATLLTGDMLSTEAYEERSQYQIVRYILGAMERVDAKYTQKSIDEGDRVIDQLSSGLRDGGYGAAFEYQGSVPLDVHIKGASDVDILVLDGRILTYDKYTADQMGRRYSDPPNKTPIQCLLELRADCRSTLSKAFPRAQVDSSGAKSITISGGSLARKVDIVPSYWHDSANYLRTGLGYERAVTVLDSKTPELIVNTPFLYMQKINEKENETHGGAKKAIRLLKTLRADSDEEINLSSYDIASLVWHFDSYSIDERSIKELSIVVHVQKELKKMCDSYADTAKLRTPDDTRAIIESVDKFKALKMLSVELDTIIEDAAREVNHLAAYLYRDYGAALESIVLNK